MFAKVLVANRGEIACRIIKTAGQLGIKTIAVYSTVDKNSKHVSMADEAFCIGGAPASESYLRGEKIIDVALKNGANAIHPGYGFLSENADFAQLCLNNDIVFIGPSVSAIKAMGSKSNAKDIMAKAGVPLVPGYHGDDQSLENLLASAKDIGFPVLLKPAAGGGGKGMHIVDTAAGFPAALESSKREAMASFSNDEVLVEKYLIQPRHVEIQVFADNHGGVVHLFERDCSVQRRHQKIIEEAPAPGISDQVRKSMADVAIKAASAIGYTGAGTVEFLYDSDANFYFMEMNTRLQVEHPVTEMITGLDLVEWQFLVAMNQKLPLQQDQIKCDGHAFEVRIYAEDPDQDFLPATGSIVHLKLPEESSHVRIDTGIRRGDAVSIYYDPMIAKLIVWDRSRNTALARLRSALDEFQVVGVSTNIEFLSALAANENFNNQIIDTGFIDNQKHILFPEKSAVADDLIVIAALYIMLKRDERSKRQADQSTDSYSPWHQVSGWRTNQQNIDTLDFVDFHRIDPKNPELPGLIKATVHIDHANYQIGVNGNLYTASGKLEAENLVVKLSGQIMETQVIEHRRKLHIFSHGKSVVLGFVDTDHQIIEIERSGNLIAPMPGTIIDVSVGKGDRVKKNQDLLKLEAMKMEHTISAPVDGIVTEIFYEPGEMVEEGSELITIDPLKE
ncbi:MAG: acetyl/propionyl/methylcrotonyl-CoA carboxylase subunit alpha [Candidatus Marinimicrobia bacterium]|nr:acetyl/propionyl/methylcrotonyl-CoA carboxylase subunit alpha [Candidatus Neomarinimicrobiota bacterium]